MITKKQWRQFCWDLHDTQREFGSVTLRGRLVKGVDFSEYKIVTIRQGEPPMRYTFEESVSENTRLKDLYASVTFIGTMKNLFGMHRDLKNEK